MPTRCNRGFLLQILLLAQHVSGTTMPIIRSSRAGPYLRMGPGPGRHIKIIEIEVWYAEKKGCPRERNLREIYTENNVGTEFSRYDATGARRS